jgi:hypothetical protein
LAYIEFYSLQLQFLLPLDFVSLLHELQLFTALEPDLGELVGFVLPDVG